MSTRQESFDTLNIFDNGYLIKGDHDYNIPTQSSVKHETIDDLVFQVSLIHDLANGLPRVPFDRIDEISRTLKLIVGKMYETLAAANE